MQISWAGLFGVLPFFSFSRPKDHLLEKNKKNLKGCGDLSL